MAKKKKIKVDPKVWWVVGGIIVVAVIAAAFLMASDQGIIKPITIPGLPAGPEQPIKLCDYNGVCDGVETRESCPEDCIEPQALSVERDEESPVTDSTPTVEILMESGTGVASCGTGTNDATQWECVVEEPGAISTMVRCTLLNYHFDGKYMLALRCKDNNGADLPMQLIDDTTVCADPVTGCGRWL
ncbi:hypothetical protein ACFLQ2_00820 [archaeon]